MKISKKSEYSQPGANYINNLKQRPSTSMEESSFKTYLLISELSSHALVA
jgi:hypothetical protein